VGILNFRENTDDGFLKVTLAIGTVDQNLKLQQGINERLMGNLVQQQMPQQIQNQNYNTFPNQTQNNNNQQSTNKTQTQVQEDNNLQNEAILTLNPKQNSEKKDNKESEREPEFSKYVKQLKVLH